MSNRLQLRRPSVARALKLLLEPLNLALNLGLLVVIAAIAGINVALQLAFQAARFLSMSLDGRLRSHPISLPLLDVSIDSPCLLQARDERRLVHRLGWRARGHCDACRLRARLLRAPVNVRARLVVRRVCLLDRHAVHAWNEALQRLKLLLRLHLREGERIEGERAQ